MPELPKKFPIEITNKYEVLPNALRQVVNDDWRDRLEVEIGDEKQLDIFYPQLKLKRWDNEVNFSVRLKDTNYEQAQVTTSGDKVIWSKGNIDIEYYDYAEGEGGYKMVWYLKQKPSTNKIEFSIQTKGLDFFYQPPLTQEEIDKGAIRPENVIGSYAVYTSEQKTNWIGGKEYKAGKVCHIYRPKIIDAKGQETWGVLNIDIVKGIYSVEIPQEFLDKAVYPIRSNDTFGYTTIGGTDGWPSPDTLYGYRFTSPADIAGTTVNSMSVYIHCTTVSKHSKQTLHLQSDKSLLSNGVTAAVDLLSDYQWHTGNFSTSPSLSNSTDYILSVIIDDTTYATEFRYDTGTSEYSWREANSYSSPTNYSSPVLEDTKLSIYCTYTAGGTAALTGTAVPTITETDIVNGGKTIIVTLTGDTWVAEGETFDAQRQNIINGIDSAQSEATGWDAVVKAGQSVGNVVRTSDTVVTITLDAFATYDITATETITATIPATALTGGSPIVASPTFQVTPVAAGGVLTFLQSTSSATDASEYTFSSQNLGDAAADRYIIVAVGSRDSGTTSQSISSVTVGGVSATIVVQQRNSATNTDVAGLAIAAVPNGTTGDVIVTFSETMLRCSIALYRATGLSSATPTDNGSSTATAPTYAIDVLAGGFAIGTANSGVNSGTATWTNLTEDYDALVTGEYLNYTGASDTFETEQTNLAVTCTFTSSTNPVGVFASWAFSAPPAGAPPEWPVFIASQFRRPMYT